MVVGVVGGGQLGRMLGLAGIPLGHSFVFLDPDPACPASAVGPVVQGAYDDPAALLRLAERVDVATFEFENVPAAAVEALAARVPTAPGARSLAVSQDRIAEKEFFRACGIRVQPFEAVGSEAELAAACGRVGTPAVLKTRRLGYDGKGQAVVRSPLDLPDAWRAVGGAPCIYEAFVDFECEVSAVVVRARDGDLRGWAVGRNEHRGGILRRTVVPAPGIDAAIAAEAQRAAGAVAEALGHVGVLAVEFFVTADGLVANEMAPRVHNSAHWTIDGSVTSQFANHVRAVCDEPLGSTDLVGPSAMVNLVGSMPDRADLLAVPGARLHDYAKAPRPGRKIGHVNVCAPDERVRDAQLRVLEELVDRAAAAARAGVAGVGAPGAR
jgi:5-(carboxyamino)imidazole ribonucleotide synthase